MLIEATLIGLIITSFISVDWAPTLNSLLLVILAIITGFGNHRARRDRREMVKTAAIVSERTEDIQKQITDAQVVLWTEDERK